MLTGTRYYYHSAINPQFMNLVALMKSLVGHLGYYRTDSEKGRFKFLIDGPDGLSAGYSPSKKAASDSRNIEKYRAFAGCFVIASMSVFPISQRLSIYTCLCIEQDLFQLQKSRHSSTPKVSKQPAKLWRIEKKTRSTDRFHILW